MGGRSSTDTTGAPGVWGLTYRCRPVSLNASYGHDRHTRTQHVIEWRSAFWALAKEQKVPPLMTVEIVVQCGMSGRLQDIGNCYVSAKAAIDGLVLAQVIPDDVGAHLVDLRYLPPVRIPPSEQDYMTLTIIDHDTTLEKRITGALKSCIAAHGPITKDWVGSAAKRLIGIYKR